MESLIGFNIKERLMRIALLLIFIMSAPIQVYGKAMQIENIALEIVGLNSKRNFIEVIYRVKNKSERDIWLCESVNGAENGYISIVNKQEKNVLFQIKSLEVPKEIFLEAPIFARYRRISPGKSLAFTLKANVPIYSQSPLGTDRSNSLNIANINTVILELGYFNQDLNATSKCCIKTSNPNKLMVNCFWAEVNDEKILRATHSVF